MIYASTTEYSSKALPNLCYNSCGCQNLEPDYLKQWPHLDIKIAKYNEYDQKWFTYWSPALKQWGKKTFV